jgi:transposase
MDKIDLRKQSNYEKEAIRKRAIIMLKKGISKTEIATSLGVHRNSVRNWILSYELEGNKGLKSKKTGFKEGQGRLLSPKQEKAIINMIIDKMPEQFKLPFGLWTRKAVKELIYRQYKIKIAIRTMGDYLKRWGFSSAKAKEESLRAKLKGGESLVRRRIRLDIKEIKKRRC